MKVHLTAYTESCTVACHKSYSERTHTKCTWTFESNCLSVSEFCIYIYCIQNGINNAFVKLLEEEKNTEIPYPLPPLVHMLNFTMRTEKNKTGYRSVFSLFVFFIYCLLTFVNIKLIAHACLLRWCNFKVVICVFLLIGSPLSCLSALFYSLRMMLCCDVPVTVCRQPFI